MKYLCAIDFAGVAEIYADSSLEAIVKFRNWIAQAPGSLHLNGYNCVNCEEVEENDIVYDFSDFAFRASHKYGIKSKWRQGEGTICPKCHTNIFWNDFENKAFNDSEGHLICPVCGQKI